MNSNEKSSRRLGKIASQVLRDDRYSSKSKSLAGSVLTQRPSKKK
jgi:hypothetical protein